VALLDRHPRRGETAEDGVERRTVRGDQTDAGQPVGLTWPDDEAPVVVVHAVREAVGEGDLLHPSTPLEDRVE